MLLNYHAIKLFELSLWSWCVKATFISIVTYLKIYPLTLCWFTAFLVAQSVEHLSPFWLWLTYGNWNISKMAFHNRQSKFTLQAKEETWLVWAAAPHLSQCFLNQSQTCTEFYNTRGGNVFFFFCLIWRAYVRQNSPWQDSREQILYIPSIYFLIIVYLYIQKFSMYVYVSV